MDRALTGTTTLDHSGPGSIANEEVLHTPQNWIAQLTGAIEYTDCIFTEG